MDRDRSRSPPLRPGTLLRIEGVADCEQRGERWQRLLLTVLGHPVGSPPTRVIAVVSFARPGRGVGAAREAAAAASLAGRPVRLLDEAGAQRRSAGNEDGPAENEFADTPSWCGEQPRYGA